VGFLRHDPFRSLPFLFFCQGEVSWSFRLLLISFFGSRRIGRKHREVPRSPVETFSGEASHDRVPPICPPFRLFALAAASTWLAAVLPVIRLVFPYYLLVELPSNLTM